MSKLDQEYKKRFAEQKFPASLKDKGWKSMDKMLDKEFPVKPASPGYGNWLGGAALVVLISAGTWWFVNKSNSVSETSPVQESPSISTSPSEKVIPQDNIGGIIKEEDIQPYGQNGNENVNSGNNDVTNIEISAINDYNNQGKSAESEEFEKVTVNSSPISVQEESAQQVQQISIAIPEHTADQEENPSGKIINTEEQSITSVDNQNPIGVEVIPKKEITVADENESQIGEIQEENVVQPENTDPGKAVVQESGNLAEDNMQENNNPTAKVTSEEPQISANSSVADSISTVDKSRGTENSKLEIAHYSFGLDDNSTTSGNFTLPFGAAQRFSVSTWIGYSYIGKILRGENPSTEKRRLEETPVWRISSGFMMDYYFNKKWTLSFGTSISEYGENIEYSSPLVYDTAFVDGRNGSPRNFPNIIRIDSIRIIDSINVGHWNYDILYQRPLNDSLQTANGESNWRYVEIPVLLGYRFGTGKLRPWLRSGPVLGIPVQSDFRYISSSDAYQLQKSDFINAYRPPIQLSWELKLGADVFLHPNWSVGINGMAAIQLNPSLQYGEIKQRYYRVGGNLALRYHF